MKWNEIYAQQTEHLGNTSDGETLIKRGRRVTWNIIPRTRSNRFGLYHYDANCTRIFTATTENEESESNEKD